jgi:hypothetical protein
MRDLFKSNQQRQAEREAKVRTGRIRIRQHVEREKKLAVKVMALAKRALELNDEAQFKQLGKRYLVLLEDINRKERYVLSLDALETQLEQSRTSVDFMETMKDLTGSVLALGSPEATASLQRRAVEGLANAQTMSDKLDAMLDQATDMLFDAEAFDDARLKELEATLMQTPAAGRAAQADDAIDGLLNRIREEIKPK